MRNLEALATLQPQLAWLLATVPPALPDALRADVEDVLEQLILQHGRLQGRAIQEWIEPKNDGLTLIFIGDAKTPEEIEEKFRQFMAESVVDQGDDETVEEMVDAGVRELEANGEEIEDVLILDMPPDEYWNTPGQPAVPAAGDFPSLSPGVVRGLQSDVINIISDILEEAVQTDSRPSSPTWG